MGRPASRCVDMNLDLLQRDLAAGGLPTLAQCLLSIEGESHEAEADELFQRALQLAPVGDLAEKIKNQQRRLADRVMCANAKGMSRMDAAM